MTVDSLKNGAKCLAAAVSFMCVVEGCVSLSLSTSWQGIVAEFRVCVLMLRAAFLFPLWTAVCSLSCAVLLSLRP